jgi:8-oxo-dGTP pyrophosphatase MutT (NUDIX family)
MDKFTKLKRNDFEPESKKEDILYKDEHLKLIKFEEYTTLIQKDCVFCVPVLIEKNQILVRKEYIPSYKLKTGQEFHLSFIGGSIEQGETPEEALLREIQEEAGLILRDNFKIEFEKPMFLFKGCSNQCHMSIIFLTENDYEETRPTTDGSKFEKMSQTAKVDFKYITSLIPSDILTQLLILKLSSALNL